MEPLGSALVSPGDTVDVLLAAADGPATVVARGVLVLSVPQLDRQSDGTLLVVAADRSTAARLASAAVTGQLSLALLPRDPS